MGEIIYLQSFLEEVDKMRCPREGGKNLDVPCILIHCRKHLIHEIYSPEEFFSRSIREIIKTMLLLKETCTVVGMGKEKSLAQLEKKIAKALGTTPASVRKIITCAFKKLKKDPKVREIYSDYKKDLAFH